eukprot:894147-Prorocentrum_minimum.AAC.4
MGDRPRSGRGGWRGRGRGSFVDEKPSGYNRWGEEDTNWRVSRPSSGMCDVKHTRQTHNVAYALVTNAGKWERIAHCFGENGRRAGFGARPDVGTSDDFGAKPGTAFSQGRSGATRWAGEPGPQHPHQSSVYTRRTDAPRRASPPRPSLLCGDLANCHRVFGDLKQSVESAMQFDQSHPAEFLGGPRKEVANKWQSLVRRARSLRETLVSLHEMSPFTLDAYEMSADICLRASDWGEFLKCQQQLVQVVYPSLEESNGLGETWSSSRWPEFVSIGIIYFACVGRGSNSVELSTTLRGMPQRFLCSPPVRLSLELLEALLSGNYIRVIRLMKWVASLPGFLCRKCMTMHSAQPEVSSGSGHRRKACG